MRKHNDHELRLQYYATFRRLAELIRIRDHASIQHNLGLSMPGAIESTLCNLAGLT